MRRKYFIVNFLNCSEKNGLLLSARQFLETIDCIFEIFRSCTNELDGQLTRFILHNMIQNNENIFGPGLPNAIPREALSQRQSNVEWWRTSMTEKPYSSTPSIKLNFNDKNNEDSECEIIGTKITASNNQEFAGFFQVSDISSGLAADAEMNTCKTKNDERKINQKEGLDLYQESESNIRALIRENKVGIRSMLIIRESGNIGVEIEICKQSEEDSGHSGNTNCPNKVGDMRKLPLSCPSKCIQSFPCDSPLTVDYSDSNILYFLAQRFLSITSYRNIYMKQILDCFIRFLVELHLLTKPIMKIKTLVEEFSMAKYVRLCDFFEKMHNDMRMKVDLVSEKALSLIKDVEKDIDVLKTSLEKLEEFVKEQGPLLSTNNKTILTIDNLRKLEFRLNEICKQADETLNLQDARIKILVNMSVDFDQLAKHFVRFLIITQTLKPPLDEQPMFNNGKKEIISVS